MRLFSKQWFEVYQLPILIAVNTPIPKWREYVREQLGLIGVSSDMLIKEVYTHGYKVRLDKYHDAMILHSRSPIAKDMMLNFHAIWEKFHKFDMKIANPFIPALNLGYDTYLTLYPDADPETNTVDGYAQSPNDLNWSAARINNGVASNDISFLNTGISSSASTNLWGWHYRTIIGFDLVGLIVNCSAAELRLTPIAIYDQDTVGWNGNIAVVEGALTSNTAVVSADYQLNNSKTTRFATDTLISSYVVGTQKTLTFNAAGISYLNVNKGAVTNILLRHSEEADNLEPTWEASKYERVDFKSADTGAGKPELYITIPSSGRKKSGISIGLNRSY